MLDDRRQERFAEMRARHLSLDDCAIKLKLSKSLMARWGRNQDIMDRIAFMEVRYKNAMDFWSHREPPSGEQIITEIMRVYENASRDQDKLKALELLGRYRALFTERQEITELPRRVVIEDEHGQNLTVIDGQATSEAA